MKLKENQPADTEHPEARPQAQKVAGTDPQAHTGLQGALGGGGVSLERRKEPPPKSLSFFFVS